MIKINDKYYLSSDAYAITICEKKVAQKGKNKGKTEYEPIAYCGTLKQVKEYLVTHELMENIDLIQNIDEIRKLCGQIDDSFMEFYWQQKGKQ